MPYLTFQIVSRITPSPTSDSCRESPRTRKGRDDNMAPSTGLPASTTTLCSQASWNSVTRARVELCFEQTGIKRANRSGSCLGNRPRSFRPLEARRQTLQEFLGPQVTRGKDRWCWPATYSSYSVHHSVVLHVLTVSPWSPYLGYAQPGTYSRYEFGYQEAIRQTRICSSSPCAHLEKPAAHDVVVKSYEPVRGRLPQQ